MAGSAGKRRVGPVEEAALASVAAMRAEGRVGPEHEAHLAVVVAAARAVDQADADGGKTAYSASVLAKLLDEWVGKPKKDRPLLKSALPPRAG